MAKRVKKASSVREVPCMVWTAAVWEESCDVVARRIRNAPLEVKSLPSWQAAMQLIDHRFEVGDVHGFSCGAYLLIEFCRDTIQAQHLQEWWD